MIDENFDENAWRARLHTAIDPVSTGTTAAIRIAERLAKQRLVRGAGGAVHTGIGARSPRWHALASMGMAAVVVAALTLTILVGHRAGNGTPTPGATEPASGNAAGSAVPPVIPQGSDATFVWLTSPRAKGSTPGLVQQTTIRIVDWTGAQRATFALPAATAPVPPHNGGGQTLPPVVQTVIAVSPDGRVAALFDGTLLDHTGAVVGHLPASWSSEGLSAVVWAADDQHVCRAAPPPQPAPIPPGRGVAPDPHVYVDVADLAGNTRRVATLTDQTAAGETDVSIRTQVLACNSTSSRVVVARYVQKVVVSPSGVAHPTLPPVDAIGQPGGDRATVWLLDMADGRVITALPGLGVYWGRSMITSPDGTLLVEFPPGQDPGPPPRIVSLVDGSVRPNLGTVDVAAVSSDNTRAVVRTYGNIGTHQGGHDTVSVVDLATGRVLWEHTEANGAVTASEPGAASFLVAMGGAQFGNVTQPTQLVLVDGAGHWRQLTFTAAGIVELAGPLPLSRF